MPRVVLQEPGVRRGVERAQPQVRRHRVDGRSTGSAVGQVDLVGVAGAQLLLHLGERVARSRPGVARSPARGRGGRRRRRSTAVGVVDEPQRRASRIHTASGTSAARRGAGRSGRQA